MAAMLFEHNAVQEQGYKAHIAIELQLTAPNERTICRDGRRAALSESGLSFFHNTFCTA